MKNLLKPNEYVGKIQKINFDNLLNRGLIGLIIDLDNTLIPWDQDLIPEKVINFIKDLKRKGFKICILSNNSIERINHISNILGVDGIWKAIKPRKIAFERAIGRLGTNPSETVVIGDQLFTDILGGNRNGLYTILVKPMSREEFIGTKFIRLFENVVLKILKIK